MKVLLSLNNYTCGEVVVNQEVVDTFNTNTGELYEVVSESETCVYLLPLKDYHNEPVLFNKEDMVGNFLVLEGKLYE